METVIVQMTVKDAEALATISELISTSSTASTSPGAWRTISPCCTAATPA